MDKLRPLIVHRFWIITVLSLVLSLVGWSVGTGTLEQQFDDKASTIDGAFSSLPDGSTTPNNQWIKLLDQVNGKERAAVNRSAMSLWDRQQSLMFWPNNMSKDMQQYPYMSQDIPIKLARRYRTSYEPEFVKLWRTLDPFSTTGKKERIGKGTIVAPLSRLPHLPRFTAAPGATVMWNSMEDIWLLKGLFGAIRDVNDGARTLADAPIRELISVELRGGTGTDIGSTGLGGGGGGAMGEDGTMGKMDGCGGGGGGGCGGSSDGAFGGCGLGDCSGGGGGSVDIDLSQDVGSDSGVSSGDGEGFGRENSSSMESVTSGDCGDCGDSGGSQGSGERGKRYVDDNPDDAEQKFKTRAFKLHLLMHVDKVPNLLAALNNVSWPVRILRVHQKAKSPEFLASGGGGGSGGFGASGGSGFSSSGGSGFGSPSSGGFSSSGGSGFGAPSSGGFSSSGGSGFGSPGSGGSGFGSPGTGGFSSTGNSGFGSAGRRGGASKDANIDPAEALEIQREMEKAQQILKSAMEDPYLAEVVVTGLLTIYQPPGSELMSEENTDDSSSESADSATSSTPDGQSPLTPNESTGTKQSQPDGSQPESVPPTQTQPGESSPETETQGESPAGEKPTPNLPAGTTPPGPAVSPIVPIPDPEKTVTEPPE